MKRNVEELQKRRRTQYMRLTEFADATDQLAQALQRKDEISAKLFIAMREEPLSQLSEIEEGIQKFLQKLPEDDAWHLLGLLDEIPTQDEASDVAAYTAKKNLTAEENALYELSQQYHRLLQKILAQDRQISTGLYGKKSFYNKFR